MNFLKWYKDKVESAGQEPPEGLWDDIQNDLDIDIVFSRLENSLHKDRRKIWIWRTSAAAGILLLLAVGTLLFYGPDIQVSQIAHKDITEQQSDTTHSIGLQTTIPFLTRIDSLSIKSEAISNVSEFQKKLAITNISVESGLTEDNYADSTEVQFTAPIIDDASDDFAPVEFSIPKQGYIALNNELPPVNLIDEHESGFLEINTITNPKKPFSNLTIGLNGEFANTWMVNNKTLEGLQPDNFTATLPTFSNNYGFNIAAELTERWDMVSQISLSRQYGQNYNEYIHGKYVSNNIHLEYFDISLAGRYRPFLKRPEHTISAGLYSGFLQDAWRSIDGQNTSIAAEYSNTDYGVIAGYEYRTPLSDQIILGAGVSYRMGIKNVFTGNELVSSNLNHSINTSFNFSLSVGYKFSL